MVLKHGFNNFIDLIPPDGSADLAMESEVDGRLINYQDSKWQVSHGPFESYGHLGETNWSLLVQAVDHQYKPTTTLMQPFCELPDWRVGNLMIFFSIPDGGVGSHLDQYDVFIVQGAGRCRWRMGEKPQMKQHYPHPGLLQVDPPEVIIGEELEPGDILYIPLGFPREGYVLENAINYSVGFHAPNTWELISEFADCVLRRELGGNCYNNPDIPSRVHLADVLPQEMDKLREMMFELTDQPECFRQWFGGSVSQSRHELDIAPPESPYQPDEIYDALKQGDVSVRLESLCALRISSNVYANGEKIGSPHRPVLDALASNIALIAENFGDALEDPPPLTMLAALVNSGYWLFGG